VQFRVNQTKHDDYVTTRVWWDSDYCRQSDH